MKKILKFLLDRPELDGVVLGILLTALPLAFKNGYSGFEDLLENELPEWDDWQLWFLLAIPVGAVIGSLVRGKFNFSLGGKKLFPLILNTLFAIAGGILFAAGMILSGNLLLEHGTAAAAFSASAWIFLAACLITASLLSLIFCRPDAGGGEK